MARLFAAILCDSGVREKNDIIELTAQQAKDGGIDEFRKAIAKAKNGVLFIDEAYDLDPQGDFKGKPIVNELLTLCETNRDEISVILAGYEDDFEKKFFAYNEGLKSRFRMCHFEDFDENELQTIWSESRKRKGWEEEEGVAQVVVKRLMKSAGRKGFGNAREVRSRLEQATQSAMSRLGHNFSMKTMKLKIEDVIGRDPRLSNEKLQGIIDEIQEKVGWGRVKKHIAELVKLCGVNYERELLGQPPLDIFLNRMFLGNPGKLNMANVGDKQKTTAWKKNSNEKCLCRFVQVPEKLPVQNCMVAFSKNLDFSAMVLSFREVPRILLVKLSANHKTRHHRFSAVPKEKF